MQAKPKTFGDSLSRKTTNAASATVMTVNWGISEKAKKEIEEIEANSRAAEQQSGSIIFG